MKKHITICGLIGGLLISGISIETAGDQLIEAPYKDKPSIGVIGEYNGVKVHNTLYDIDDDGLYEVSEIRRILGVTEDGVYVQEQPIIYGFDINENGIFEDNEVLVDINEDGLNGNETNLLDYITNEKTSV